ncbi:hypothetical protein DFJ73DRAFT_961556 [Zopfochytrium polystomum]|nr:hypothetical protein DFJ73DRAFT_961556 [Zopfochytrium polystomum]
MELPRSQGVTAAHSGEEGAVGGGGGKKEGDDDNGRHHYYSYFPPLPRDDHHRRGDDGGGDGNEEQQPQQQRLGADPRPHHNLPDHHPEHHPHHHPALNPADRDDIVRQLLLIVPPRGQARQQEQQEQQQQQHEQQQPRHQQQQEPQPQHLQHHHQHQHQHHPPHQAHTMPPTRPQLAAPVRSASRASFSPRPVAAATEPRPSPSPSTRPVSLPPPPRSASLIAPAADRFYLDYASNNSNRHSAEALQPPLSPPPTLLVPPLPTPTLTPTLKPTSTLSPPPAPAPAPTATPEPSPAPISPEELDRIDHTVDPVPTSFGFVIVGAGSPPAGTTSSAAQPTPFPVRIYYELFGTGPTRLVLVSGLGATGAGWYPNITRLLALYPSRLQILVIDNRAIGFSTTDPTLLGQFSIKDMAMDVERVMDHVGWGEPHEGSGGGTGGTGCCDVHVVGHSMGGMIVQEMLLLPSAKRRYRAAVLLSTTAVGRAMPSWDTLVQAIKKPPNADRDAAGAADRPSTPSMSPTPSALPNGGSGDDAADVAWAVELAYPKEWLDQPAIGPGAASPIGYWSGKPSPAAADPPPQSPARSRSPMPWQRGGGGGGDGNSGSLLGRNGLHRARSSDSRGGILGGPAPDAAPAAPAAPASHQPQQPQPPAAVTLPRPAAPPVVVVVADDDNNNNNLKYGGDDRAAGTEARRPRPRSALGILSLGRARSRSRSRSRDRSSPTPPSPPPPVTTEAAQPARTGFGIIRTHPTSSTSSSSSSAADRRLSALLTPSSTAGLALPSDWPPSPPSPAAGGDDDDGDDYVSTGSLRRRPRSAVGWSGGGGWGREDEEESEDDDERRRRRGGRRLTNRDVMVDLTEKTHTDTHTHTHTHTQLNQRFRRVALTKPRQPPAAFLKQLRAVLAHNVPASRLRSIADLGVPVHVVAGTADRVVRFDATEKLHRRIPGSRMTVVRGAGHGVSDEAPGVVEEVLRVVFGW